MGNIRRLNWRHMDVACDINFPLRHLVVALLHINERMKDIYQPHSQDHRLISKNITNFTFTIDMSMRGRTVCVNSSKKFVKLASCK